MDEDNDEDALENLYDACSIKELKRIMDLNLDLGYNPSDPKDKMEFFNLLPKEDRIKLFEEYL